MKLKETLLQTIKTKIRKIDLPDELKQCKVCEVWKPRSEFYTAKTRGYTWHRYSCKVCHQIQSCFNIKLRAYDKKILKSIDFLQMNGYHVEFTGHVKKSRVYNPDDKKPPSIRSKLAKRALGDKKEKA